MGEDKAGSKVGEHRTSADELISDPGDGLDPHRSTARQTLA
jgi:hypothetical protein